MIPALAWAAMSMDHEDRKAAAEAEQARDERVMRGEDFADVQAVRDRIWTARHGYTQGELHRWQQEREAERQERIAELEAELNRLAPERVPQAARFSTQEAEADALLAQAARLRTDPLVQRELRRFRERRGGRPVISRSAASGERALCIDCAIVGATEDQSTLIHLEPGAPAPRYVPDEPPETRSRSSWQGEAVRCGTGWPR